MPFDFGEEVIQVKSGVGFSDSRRPMMSYSPRVSESVRDAFNRHDWRELRRLNAVWWDPYADRWFKFGPTFWDA